MKHRSRVVLEPALELQVITLDWRARRSLARVYFRWAKQLYVSSAILRSIELDALPKTERKAPSLHPRKAVLN